MHIFIKKHEVAGLGWSVSRLDFFFAVVMCKVKFFLLYVSIVRPRYCWRLFLSEILSSISTEELDTLLFILDMVLTIRPQQIIHWEATRWNLSS